MASHDITDSNIVTHDHDIESQAASFLHSNEADKSLQDVDIHEVDGSTMTPRADRSLRWSGSDTAASEKDPPSRQSSLRTKTAARLSKTGTWTFEVISLLIAAAFLAGICGILGRYNGRAIPEWPLNITLSALIALLATVATANLAVPLQSGLSQLKWIRFNTGRAPLSDMEIYDEASRGTWGAVKLLVQLRGGVFASFGAVLTILTLTLGPFSQQIASYRSHMVQSPAGASIPRALNYTGYLPGKSSSNGFVPILPMKSAVYSGLYAENNNPLQALNVTCATGNCTFPTFETLAVCYACVDMTPYMSRYCQDGTSASNDTDCGWQLPGGAAFLNKSTDAFSMTSSFPSAAGNMPYATIMRLTFMGTESQTVPDVLNPWAQQCSLSTCVQTINSTVTNGYLDEIITNNLTNGTVVDISTSNATDVPINLVSPSSNNTFTLAMGSKLAMESWFSDVFKNGSASRSTNATNQTFSDSNVIVNLTVGVSSGETFFDTDIVTAFYWNYYEYANGIPMLMEDLAISMTVAMRSFMGAVPHAGSAWLYESFVHVRWVFITVPVVVVVLTALFLATTIWRTEQSHTEIWKSSALAVLCHGLDASTREHFEGAMSLVEKKRRAMELTVQLDAGDAGSFLRS